MLVEQDIFNKKQFLELFQKRFFSFCEKSPLFIRFTMLEDRVLVYDLSRNAEINHLSIYLIFKFLKKKI